MPEERRNYCIDIFKLVMKECNKRGEGSKECSLLKSIFNTKCINKKDCIKLREVLLECCYNTDISKSYINKECILLTKSLYDKC